MKYAAAPFALTHKAKSPILPTPKSKFFSIQCLLGCVLPSGPTNTPTPSEAVTVKKTMITASKKGTHSFI
jgi:hypothetical protein